MSARPAADDEATFLGMVRENAANAALLELLPQLALPDCHLVSGCLFQTVWNCLSGKDPAADIVDYDVFYHEPWDLSWEAEDEVIRRAQPLFESLGVTVEIRNQARVHLWYENRFGLPSPPLQGTRDAIDHFLNQSSCFGIGPHAAAPQVYAPFGYADLFSMTVRPNCRRNLPQVYYRKAHRWSAAWPALKVLPWPDG